MAYVYTLFVILVIGYVVYRIYKKNSSSSNRYTPYDDITMGNKTDVKRDGPIEDTKHIIQYDEKVENDKTV